jgi:hypothetical protein
MPMKRTMTGITSSLPIHITRIKTHFDASGIPGDTYPVLNPQQLRPETTSKTSSDTAKEVR